MKRKKNQLMRKILFTSLLLLFTLSFSAQVFADFSIPTQINLSNTAPTAAPAATTNPSLLPAVNNFGQQPQPAATTPLSGNNLSNSNYNPSQPVSGTPDTTTPVINTTPINDISPTATPAMTIYLSTPFDASLKGCKYYDQTAGKYLFSPLTGDGNGDGTCTVGGKKGIIAQKLDLGNDRSKVFETLMAGYISPLLKWLYGIAATVTVIMVIVGGIQMIYSGDSKGGKERIQKSLLALVVLLLASVLLHMVNPAFFTLN